MNEKGIGIGTPKKVEYRCHTPPPAAAALQDFLRVVTIACAVELGSAVPSAAIRAPETI